MKRRRARPNQSGQSHRHAGADRTIGTLGCSLPNWTFQPGRDKPGSSAGKRQAEGPWAAVRESGRQTAPRQTEWPITLNSWSDSPIKLRAARPQTAIPVVREGQPELSFVGFRLLLVFPVLQRIPHISGQSAESSDYWNDARRPLACLLFLVPWIAVYEAGILMLADADADRIRNGADFWMRSLLSAAGLGQFLLLPTLVVSVLLTWHILRRHPWRVRLETQAGMLAESLLLAMLLVVAGQVHQLLFLNLQPDTADPRLLTMATGDLTRAISYVGAGVYEEVMFRLLLVPTAFLAFRLFEFPTKWAATMAAVSTAFIFALAHHVGPSADAFNLFTFSFRATAGMFFAAIFFVRGFGITVGCHAAYDLLVGVFLVNS